MQAHLFEERYIVLEMSKIFNEILPAYPVDKTRDFKPLFSISQFIAEQIKIHGQDGLAIIDAVLGVWRKICEYIKTDNFYSQKSLSTISNHIQELTIKAAHGDKSGKKSGKLSTDTLTDKINKRFRG